MKLKHLLLSITLATTVTASQADPVSLIVGVILGAAIAQPRVVYEQSTVYALPPQVYYQTPLVVLDRSQVQYYDPYLHGYCAGYRDEQYAACIGNARRMKMEESYRQGYRSYR